MKQLLQKLKKDNKGASLVLVLMVSLLVSMLAVLILMASVSNSKMKHVEQASEQTFRSTDAAVEALTTGLEEIADQAMREAYTYMLQIFTGTVQSKRLKVLRHRFAELMADKIKEANPNPAGSKQVDMDILNNMLLTLGGKYTLTEGNGKTPTYEIDSEDSLYIRGLEITYLDDKGYETKINTDIKFSLPATIVDISKISDSIDFKGFSIITDGYANRENDVSNFNISGSIYAGSGINVNKATLNCTGEYIISRGALVVKDAGYFNASSRLSSLWVNDIETQKVTNYTQTEQTWINLSCSCYVADDLSLNADYGNVKISGNYYGYHTTNSTGIKTGNAAGSSAVLINAKYAGIDFRAPEGSENEVLISGKTYLSVPNYYSARELTDAELAANGLERDAGYSSVLQGESLSFKGVQSAYMVPGDCILGINHNPMTAAEYQKLTDAIAANSQTMRVFLGQNVKENGIDLEFYVDKEKPYVAQYVQYFGTSGSATTMVYLYLNFTSPNKAADYFVKYFEKYSTRVVNLSKFLELGDVFMSSGNVINTGNMVINDTNKDEFDIIAKNRDYTDSIITKREITYARKYKGLQTYLDEMYYTNDTSATACDLLIHFNTDAVDGQGLQFRSETQLIEGQKGFRFEETDENHDPSWDSVHPFVLITPFDVEAYQSDSKVYVKIKETGPSGGEKVYEIDSDVFEGLIISAGTVTFNNVTFNGMTIAKAGVELKGTSTLTNHEFTGGTYRYLYSDVDALGRPLPTRKEGTINDVEQLIKHDQNIYKWFATYDPSGVEDYDNQGKNSVSIEFVNWQKNN